MRRGFTLIELLVVVAIIGVLSSLFVSNYMEIRKKSRDAKRMADLKEIQKALELYKQDQSLPVYPASLPAPCSEWKEGEKVYMNSMPGDPKGNCSSPIPYFYQPKGDPPTEYNLIACLESRKNGDNIKNCSAYGVAADCSDLGGNGKCYVVKP